MGLQKREGKIMATLATHLMVADEVVKQIPLRGTRKREADEKWKVK